MKLSVIIPLYNCGSYIIRCLDSIYNQGLKNEDFEIIVVNDGSTDSGPGYVAEFKRSHNNITLVNQKNSGVSIARNNGLKHAKGEWIHFIDADDYLVPNSYKFIFDNHYIEGCNILKFSSKTVGDSENINYNNSNTAKILFNGLSIDYVKKYGFNGAVITSLYNREFLNNHNIYFEPYTCYEDLLFNIRCYSIPDIHVKYTDLIVYLYYVRANSSSRNITKDRCFQIINDCIGINNEIREIISKTNQNSISSQYIPILQNYQNRLKRGAFHMIVIAKGLVMSDLRRVSKSLYPPQFYPILTKNKSDRIKNIIIRYPILLWVIKKMIKIKGK